MEQKRQFIHTEIRSLLGVGEDVADIILGSGMSKETKRRANGRWAE